MNVRAGTTYQFGPFEAHSGSGELFKQGQRVKIQEQPFRLLVVLLENSGEIVTREEIQRRMWEENTFVDFDSGLRVAVRKLRDALGDDAENPRYIETIPKRGYRFLSPAVRSWAAANHVAEIEATRAPVEERTPSRLSTRPSTRPAIKWVLVAAGVLLAGAIVLLVSRRGNSIRLSEKDSVVLADFTNSTGDPVFDETLRQGMAVQLAQSPFLNVISDERMQQVLRLMGQSTDVKLSPEIAREICERTGSAVVLDGSIAPLGSQYVLGLRAMDCQTGADLAQEQVQAARKEDVLNALDRIAIKFRTRLGESLTTVKEHNTPLVEATTPSLEALKAYSAGWRVISSTGTAAGVPFFKHSIEIDPNFAMAHATLGLVYGDMGESSLGMESTTRAFQLQGHTSDRERYFINASYEFHATGNLEKTQEICDAYAKTYPREVVPLVFLTVVYISSGKYEEAIEESKKITEVDPDQAVGYSALANGYESVDRLQDAESALQQASQRKLEMPDYFAQRYDIAFLKSDEAGMEREIALSQGKSGVEDWVADRQAFALAYFGQLREARRESRRAADLAKQSTQQERAALYEAAAALREGFFGNAPEAKRSALAALELSNGREVAYGTALALALAGDSERSQRIADDLESRFPEDTSVKFSYLPTVRALLALNHAEPSRAIELLQVAAPYDLGSPRSTFHGSFGALYPIYFRGEAYLRLRKCKEAAAEFQKILDHRGIVVSDPIGALGRLQLSRALAANGDFAGAKAAYERFFSLWKNADANLPVLKDARVEYSKLK